ncbi:pseudouridine-5'-phosphatase-like [Culicoides brevitarsis]|uniref:pseudouridine-5'-phosphatase-like n=1 Tax=Culicoides brevitarsis TaxID=469753 RepID=UPI00307BCD88
MTKYAPVKAVIFDLDGTILDSESVYTTIHEDICRKYGATLPFATRVKLFGTEEQKACAIVVADCNLPCTPAEFYADFQKLSKERLAHCAVFAGVQKLITHCLANDIPIAIGSGSSSESIALKIQNYQDLIGQFHHMVTGTDPEVEKGKPAPDVFLITAKRFEPPIDPKDCLVLEDSANGVKSAKNAGMQCVMIPDPKLPKEFCTEADLVLESLEDFKPEEFGLPAYE